MPVTRRFHVVLRESGQPDINLDIVAMWLPRVGETLIVVDRSFVVYGVTHRVSGQLNTEVPPVASATVFARRP